MNSRLFVFVKFVHAQHIGEKPGHPRLDLESPNDHTTLLSDAKLEMSITCPEHFCGKI